MAKPANLALEGGLELPSLSGIFTSSSKHHVSANFTSADPCVHRIAEDDLQVQASLQRVNLCPAVAARDVI